MKSYGWLLWQIKWTSTLSHTALHQSNTMGTMTIRKICASKITKDTYNRARDKRLSGLQFVFVTSYVQNKYGVFYRGRMYASWIGAVVFVIVCCFFSACPSSFSNAHDSERARALMTPYSIWNWQDQNRPEQNK